MISVLIPTRNEYGNIGECLRSVAWADQVVVVDSGSTDGTADLARALGAEVVDFEWNRRLPKKKNWALENIAWNNEWLLILDADERITPQLAHEIQESVRDRGVDGYFVNRRLIFMGKWIRHCGYFPSWNLRLFRHRKGRYEQLVPGDTGSGDNEVHEHLVLSGPCARLQHQMLHFAYPDVFTWMEKHNRYSNWEAELEVRGETGRAAAIGAALIRKRRLKAWSRPLPFRPTLRFLYSFIWNRGFLDGRQGYALCRLLAVYETLSVIKAQELRSGARRSFDSLLSPRDPTLAKTVER